MNPITAVRSVVDEMDGILDVDLELSVVVLRDMLCAYGSFCWLLSALVLLLEWLYQHANSSLRF